MNPLVFAPTAYKLLGIAAAVAIYSISLYGVGRYQGYAKEHDKFVTFQAQVTQIGKAQQKETAALNLKIKENANAAENNLIFATNGVNNYYRSNPVIRLRNASTCSGGMSQSISDSTGSDDSTTSGFFSPYSPEQSELIAVRLFELQNLLRSDGVIVE